MPADTATTVRRQNGFTIRALRKLTPLTQAELAGYAGIRQATLSDIENESADASMATLARIAKALAVPVSAILRMPVTEDAA